MISSRVVSVYLRGAAFLSSDEGRNSATKSQEGQKHVTTCLCQQLLRSRLKEEIGPNDF